MWLIKWLLVIPHYFVLAFLWTGLFVRQFQRITPRLKSNSDPGDLPVNSTAENEMDARVGFYAFSANGTNRYPPVTLDVLPDYPARLAIDYPHHQLDDRGRGRHARRRRAGRGATRVQRSLGIKRTFAERPRLEAGDEMTPRIGEYRDYRERGGAWIPIRREARWALPDGAFTYRRGTITSLEPGD